MTNVLCGRHSINTITTEWKTTLLAISNSLLSDATLCLTVTIIFENSARCNSNSHMQNNIQHIKLQLTYSITQSLFSCINRTATRAFSLTKYSSPHTTSPLTAANICICDGHKPNHCCCGGPGGGSTGPYRPAVWWGFMASSMVPQPCCANAECAAVITASLKLPSMFGFGSAAVAAAAILPLVGYMLGAPNPGLLELKPCAAGPAGFGVAELIWTLVPLMRKSSPHRLCATTWSANVTKANERNGRGI